MDGGKRLGKHSIVFPAGEKRPLILENELLDQATAMVWYALESGLPIPTSVLRAVDTAQELRYGRSDDDAKEGPPAWGGDWADAEALGGLAAAHARLTRIVAPATPRTIALLSSARAQRSLITVLGPVRLIRHMLVLAIISLVGFIALATVDGVPSNTSIANSQGKAALENQLFLLCAAGIGASFAGLFTAHRYVANTTYDPTHESSYWVRFALGLMAGVILPSLIAPGQGPAGPAGPGDVQMTLPLLALLGGFSASFVYRVLDRLVQTAESLVKGDARDTALAREEASRLRDSQEVARDRMGVASALARLQGRLTAGVDPEEARTELAQILDRLLASAVLAADELPAEEPDGVSRTNGAVEARGLDRPSRSIAQPVPTPVVDPPDEKP